MESGFVTRMGGISVDQVTQNRYWCVMRAEGRSRKALEMILTDVDSRIGSMDDLGKLILEQIFLESTEDQRASIAL